MEVKLRSKISHRPKILHRYEFKIRYDKFFNLIPYVPFRCKFESKPLPTFSWYIDDEKLTDSTEYPTELSEDKMSQTLNYGKPREGHSNKTLKCVVDFNEYGLKDTFEESLVFDFPENVVLVPKKLDAEVCKRLIFWKFLGIPVGNLLMGHLAP